MARNPRMRGMPDTRSSVFGDYTEARAGVSTAQLLGQVMFLVAIAIGFLVVGSYVGRDLAFGTARICSFAGFGMLIVSAFAKPLRVGPIAMAWLFATSLM